MYRINIYGIHFTLQSFCVAFCFHIIIFPFSKTHRQIIWDSLQPKSRSMAMAATHSSPPPYKYDHIIYGLINENFKLIRHMHAKLCTKLHDLPRCTHICNVTNIKFDLMLLISVTVFVFVLIISDGSNFVGCRSVFFGLILKPLFCQFLVSLMEDINTITRIRYERC